MARIRIFKKALPLALICMAFFILLVFLSHAVSFDTLLSDSSSSVTAITDWKFSWSEKAPDEKAEVTDWKFANKDVSISRPANNRYIHLQAQLPKIDAACTLQIITDNNPIKIIIDGKTVLQNGYGTDTLWAGNETNSLSLDKDASGDTVDIYMQAPIAFAFSASVLPQSASYSTDALLQQWLILSGCTLFNVGLLVILLSVVLSIKNQNMGTLAICGLIILLSGAYYLLSNMQIFFLDRTNPLFYKLQLTVLMLQFASFIVLTTATLNKTSRSARWFAVLLYIYPLAFVLIQNTAVLYYMLMAFPVLFFLTLVYFAVAAAEAIHHEVVSSSWVFAGFLLFGMTYLYDLINYIYGLNADAVPLKFVGILFYYIILVTICLKSLAFINIRLDERDLQIKRDTMWIERAIRACANIFAKQEIEGFCIQTAKSIKELIINDATDQDYLSETQTSLAQDIAINVGMKTDTGYQEVYTEGSNSHCDYLLIESKHRNNEPGHVSFGRSYVDILLFEKNTLVSIIHFEGIAHGLSDNLKNIIMIAYSNISVALDNLSLKFDMTRTQETVFMNLADISESKSEETGAHAKRVAEYVKVLCDEMHMDPREVSIVSQASMMHDIGKLAIPEEILSKKGALSDREFEVIKQHVLFGYHIMSKSPGEFMQAAAIIAQQHHEQWNGGGYLGLAHEQIHPYARIVALVDVFDALLSERSYKAAWSFDQTCAYINEQAGIRFDPAVVQAFDRGLYRLFEIHEKYPD